jgi:dihydrofolate synthase/folylpolyglutamate synthase
VAGIIRALAPLAKRVWGVAIPNPRSLPPAEVARHAQRFRIPAEAAASLPQALEDATGWARETNGVIVICGSLFLAGEALELLAAPVIGR